MNACRVLFYRLTIFRSTQVPAYPCFVCELFLFSLQYCLSCIRYQCRHVMICGTVKNLFHLTVIAVITFLNEVLTTPQQQRHIFLSPWVEVLPLQDIFLHHVINWIPNYISINPVYFSKLQFVFFFMHFPGVFKCLFRKISKHFLFLSRCFL